MHFGGENKKVSENQLNKLQIKAEVLTVLSKLQTNIEAINVDEVLITLNSQEDKKTILDILTKELVKANEQKAILVCFLLIKLCSETGAEEALWDALKNPSVSDSIKTIILNVLKDLGNKVDYEKLEEYFKNPDEVIDADTQKLLQTAIINPEAQIDFLDFLSSLSDLDKKILIQSLGDDYSSDSLANILNPLILYSPVSEIGKTAIEILGETKSQLALHALSESLEFITDENTISLIKKNISKLKIAGVREDNAIEFYKNILSSEPYCSYTSYPDGHGNQAIIFSRERENQTIQIVAMVINDTKGLIDCFGFNEISKEEFERIVEKFYKNDEHIYLKPSAIKALLIDAEKLTRKSDIKISYEYLCWKTLFADIEEEPSSMEEILKDNLIELSLDNEDLEKIYMFDFIQRWFFDTEYNDNFKSIITNLNTRIQKDDFNFDLDEIVNVNLEKIFSNDQKDLLNKRILMSAYLKYLIGDIEDSQLLYSLYFDEEKKIKLAQNIVRKSIYEYYVTLKFKLKEQTKTKNIFAARNQQQESELSSKQIDLMISVIEGLWVG